MNASGAKTIMGIIAAESNAEDGLILGAPSRPPNPLLATAVCPLLPWTCTHTPAGDRQRSPNAEQPEVFAGRRWSQQSSRGRSSHGPKLGI